MKYFHSSFSRIPLKNSFRLLVVCSFAFFFSQTVSGQTGKALNFDGINDYITLPFIFSGSYTKEAWITTNSLSSFPNIISGDGSTGTALFLNSGRLAAGHGPSFNQVLDPTPLTIGTWYHVAVTYNSMSGIMNLYKNGVLVSSNAAPAYTETYQEIGRFIGNYYFDGSIDEVRIWNTERTASELLASMNCELNGSEAGLIAYYNFNEGIAGGNNTGITRLNDLHGNCPLNGQLMNFALTGATSNWVAPGGTLTSSCTAQVPNISVAGVQNCIGSGDISPSATDSTDFGSAAINTNVDVIYTIRNNGGADLAITDIAITGVDAASFSIISPAAATVAAGDSTSFTVRFTPTTSGTKNAAVEITNNDSDEGLYSFAITGMATGTVPVTLINFMAAAHNDLVILTWQTANELNNSGFEIQRSGNDGISWEKIGFSAAKTLSNGSTYVFNDPAPIKGLNAYRLRQIDKNGQSVLSYIQRVDLSSLSARITIYPNPVQDKLNLILNDSKYFNTEAKITSGSGAVISTLKIGNNFRQTVDIVQLTRGIYFIRFSDGSVQKIIKL